LMLLRSSWMKRAALTVLSFARIWKHRSLFVVMSSDFGLLTNITATVPTLTRSRNVWLSFPTRSRLYFSWLWRLPMLFYMKVRESPGWRIEPKHETGLPSRLSKGMVPESTTIALGTFPKEVPGNQNTKTERINYNEWQEIRASLECPQAP